MTHLSVKFKGDFDSILQFFKQKSSEFEHKRIAKNEFLISSSESSVAEEFFFFKSIVIDETKDLEIIDVETIGESDYNLAERYLEQSYRKQPTNSFKSSKTNPNEENKPNTTSTFETYSKEEEEKMNEIAKAFEKVILPTKHFLPEDDLFWGIIKPSNLMNYFIFSTLLLGLISIMK